MPEKLLTRAEVISHYRETGERFPEIDALELSPPAPGWQWCTNPTDDQRKILVINGENSVAHQGEGDQRFILDSDVFPEHYPVPLPKYVVMKHTDLQACLSDTQMNQLVNIMQTVNDFRHTNGRSELKGLFIREDLGIYDRVQSMLKNFITPMVFSEPEPPAPYECDGGESLKNAPPRPGSIDGEARKRIADKVAESVAQWGSVNVDVGDLSDVLLGLLERGEIMSHDSDFEVASLIKDDGILTAFELESEVIESLGSITHEIGEELRQVQHAWVEEFSIKPPLAIDTPVKYRGEPGLIAGKHDNEAAAYLVKMEGTEDGCFSIIKYEDRNLSVESPDGQHTKVG